MKLVAAGRERRATSRRCLTHGRTACRAVAHEEVLVGGLELRGFPTRSFRDAAGAAGKMACCHFLCEFILDLFRLTAVIFLTATIFAHELIRVWYSSGFLCSDIPLGLICARETLPVW